MVWFWDFSTKIVLINISVDKKCQKADFQSKNLSFWVFLAWLSRESQNYKIATFLRPSKWPKMVENSENRPKFGLNGLQILCRIEKKWVLGNSRTSGFSLFPHACPVWITWLFCWVNSTLSVRLRWVTLSRVNKPLLWCFQSSPSSIVTYMGDNKQKMKTELLFHQIGALLWLFILFGSIINKLSRIKS